MKRTVSTITLAAAALLLAASAQAADKKYDEGASDTEVKLGQTMPYSGPLSLHATALPCSSRSPSGYRRATAQSAHPANCGTERW